MSVPFHVIPLILEMNEFGKLPHHVTFPTHFRKYKTSSVGGGGVYSLPFDSILHMPSSHLPLTDMSLPNYTVLQFDVFFA